MTLRSYAMHVYTYLDGTDELEALQDLVEVCTSLGLPELPPEGPQGVHTPGPVARRSFGGETGRGIYQAVEFTTARQTALLACLVPAGDDRAWRELDAEWREAAGTAVSAECVGRVRLYYALYEGKGTAERLASLARAALPVPADLAYATELFAGCHLWEVDTAEDHRRDRTLVLLAPAAQERRSDDWVWPDGTYRLPPLPGYLWEMAKVRHEARRFEERRSLLWAQELPARAARFEHAERARVRPSAARDHELRILRRHTALASASAAVLRGMQRTVQAAAGNARMRLDGAGWAPSSDHGPFVADRAYADWLLVVMADEAATAADDVQYAGPLAALASAAAEEHLVDLRERSQALTLLQTATIVTIGLFLAATQAIGYKWRTYASVQTPFVIWVLFLGLFLPLAATRLHGRHARWWRLLVIGSGAGFAAATGCLLVAWAVRWRTGAPADPATFVVTAVAGVIVAAVIAAAWLLHSRRDRP